MKNVSAGGLGVDGVDIGGIRVVGGPIVVEREMSPVIIAILMMNKNSDQTHDIKSPKVGPHK